MNFFVINEAVIQCRYFGKDAMMPKNKIRATYYCSFCGKEQRQVQRLIAGPQFVFVCDECIVAFFDVQKQIQSPANLPSGLRCSFCGKESIRVQYLHQGPKRINICDACIDLCMEIMHKEGYRPNR